MYNENIHKKIGGSKMTPLEKLLNRSDKTEIKKLNKIVDEIDALEEKYHH